MPLADMVRDVARARKAAAEIKGEYDAAEAEFREEYAGLIADLSEAKRLAAEAEDALRAAVLAAPDEEVKAALILLIGGDAGDRDNIRKEMRG